MGLTQIPACDLVFLLRKRTSVPPGFPHCRCSLRGLRHPFPRDIQKRSRSVQCAVRHPTLLKHAGCSWANARIRHCGAVSEGGSPRSANCCSAPSPPPAPRSAPIPPPQQRRALSRCALSNFRLVINCYSAEIGDLSLARSSTAR